MTDTTRSLLDSLILEIRRGGIVLAVLACLKREEYGYSLKRSLAEHGVEIDEGTLYPLLRRLEGQGLLDSRWALEEQRPRRYYRRNAAGEELLRGLAREWKTFTKNIGGLLP
jgi:PadR family transcriptional regulator PadR